MKRIIINYPDNIEDADALHLVQEVVKEGKISGDNDRYCYLTSFGSKKYRGEVFVLAEELKSGTESFRLWVKKDNERVINR
mgnify:FL=1|jgi:hypothetical protein